MARKADQDGLRLDEAARAGWLYYVAGNTQDQIARKLGISRQAAQRLVSLAISERLIKVRLDHPIARCMELAAALKIRYDLRFCDVAPSDPDSASSTLGIAQAAAAEFERWLRRPEPAVIGIGTGRTMRAVADQLPAMECPQHKLVALVGTTKTDGSASFYDVIIRVSDTVRAPHYPMPLPVIARSIEERELLTSLASVRSLFDLVERTDVCFVGVGSVGDSAPLVQDGIITRQEAEALRHLGAVGEITGWAFDAAGRVLTEGANQRVAGAPLRKAGNRLVIGVAMGPSRRAPLRAALMGGLISGLVTDEFDRGAPAAAMSDFAGAESASHPKPLPAALPGAPFSCPFFAISKACGAITAPPRSLDDGMLNRPFRGSSKHGGDRIRMLLRQINVVISKSYAIFEEKLCTAATNCG